MIAFDIVFAVAIPLAGLVFAVVYGIATERVVAAMRRRNEDTRDRIRRRLRGEE